MFLTIQARWVDSVTDIFLSFLGALGRGIIALQQLCDCLVVSTENEHGEWARTQPTPAYYPHTNTQYAYYARTHILPHPRTYTHPLACAHILGMDLDVEAYVKYYASRERHKFLDHSYHDMLY